MKLIVAGSRSLINPFYLMKAILETGISILDIEVIVSGCAYGPDTSAIHFAKCYGIPIKTFPAEWDRYGKSAGYRRNEEMADYANALLAIWDGKSKGTKHMIDIAKKKGLRVFTYEV